MGRIKIIPEEEAEGPLRSLYQRISRARGGVADVLKIHSLLPQTLEDHFNLYSTLMFQIRFTRLRRELLEMIAVVVSAENKCGYCVAHHSVPLSRLLKDDELLRAIQDLDWTYLGQQLDPSVVAVLHLAEKITHHPSRVNAVDIQGLKDSDYSDEQILHIVLVINYFNYVNRNVLALGVELEPDYGPTCR